MYKLKVILLLLISVLSASCSQSDILAPSNDDGQEYQNYTDADGSQRLLWGFWEFRGDLRSGELEIIPIRQAEIHLNALVFLEAPPTVLIKLDGPPVVSGDEIDIDIAITHTFSLNPTFTGFDVKGIIITPANDGRYPGPFVVMADDEVTHLANPDGYTLWWGPYLFPPNDDWPNQGYIDGLMGQPDDLVNYGSNVNAYKYFCNDLGANDDVSLINPDHRGVFSIGKTNVRHYKIKVVDDTFVFNYAVDASWAWPDIIPPPNVYNDFPLHANQPEAYRAEITEIKNTLYYDGWFGGGDLILDVKVFTWRDPSTTGYVFMESPEVFTQVFSKEPVETGDGWARYRLSATSCTCRQTGPLFVLIGVQTTLVKIDMGYRSGFLTSYFPFRTSVGSTPSSDGPVGTPRGISPVEEWQDIPIPPAFYQSSFIRGSTIAVKGNRIVVPIHLNGGLPAGPRLAYAQSFDGGQTFEVTRVSTKDDPHIGGGVGYKGYHVAIDSEDGIHYLYNASSPAIEILNYSYTPAGGTPNNLVFPLGTVPDQSNERLAFLFVDSENRVHIIYVGDGPEPDTFPYRLYEITSDDYLNFTDPVECMVFPTYYWGSPGFMNGHLYQAEVKMAEDGEIFLAFRGNAEIGDGHDIYFSYGFPGSMSECGPISGFIPDAEYRFELDITVSDKDAFVGWRNDSSSDQGGGYDYPHAQICFIPYGSIDTELTDMVYPSSSTLEDFCPNTWDIPVIRQLANLNGMDSGISEKYAYCFKFSIFSPDGDILGNLITNAPSWAPGSVISENGIVTVTNGYNYPGLTDRVQFEYSPIDYY